MAKWAAIGLVAATTVAMVALDSHYRVVDRLQARDFVPPRELGVAEVHPEFGAGAPSALGDARITADGSLQVLSSGGACDALASVEVAESDTRVALTVNRAVLPGACTADVKSWFVHVPLAAPLGDRELIDAVDDVALPVTDCGDDPAPTKGICAMGPIE